MVMSQFECPESGDPLMPNCRLVSDTLSDYLEEQLGDADRILLEEHLQACGLCMIYLDQFRAVYRAAGEVDCSSLPEDFEQVMGKVIRRWQVERQSGDGKE
jgi:predicted anti-sigma-YlaC factor YlaD